MKIAVVKERQKGESRVAATPETVKKFISLGFDVEIEKSAGELSSYTDDMYKNAGAKITKDVSKDADIILAVNTPDTSSLKQGAIVIASLKPYENKAQFDDFNKAQATTFAMELAPRITRAQSMDILSSQSNLAGYRAVIEAAYEYNKAFPMMMTAAGTVAAAKVVVIGAGVAGLQAIATARRLGAIVSAFDVRAAAKEQVESLGASFVEVPAEESGDAAGGYAKEMSDEYKKRQSQVLHEHLKKQDIVITTALIPGKKAPILITAEMVKDMKEGAVIVDIAAINGGNCELTESGKIVTKHGVKIIGHENFPSRIATDASSLYARNLFNFIGILYDKESKSIKLNMDDEIIKATIITHEGKTINQNFA